MQMDCLVAWGFLEEALDPEEPFFDCGAEEVQHIMEISGE